MSESVYAGLTSQTVDIFLADSSSTTGGGLTGLVYNTASLTAYYRKGATGSATAITLVTQTVGGAYSSGGFVQIDATNMPGVYRLDLPNAVVDTEGFVSVYLHGAANLAPTALRVDCRPVPADLKQIQTVTQSATDLKDFADAGYDPATNKVQGVVLVDTTTTNTDMRGTNSALLATSAPTNFGDLAITVTTGQMTVGTNNDKTGYSISGTKTTLDALNDVAATDIVSSGAITTLTGAVVNVTTVATTTTNTDMRGTDGANTIAPATPTNVTDAQAAIITQGDIAWVTATGFNTDTTAGIVDAVWDEVISNSVHNGAQSAGQRLRQAGSAVAADGTVNDAGATATSFITDLTETTTSFYSDQTLKFTSGALEGQARVITNYNGTTKAVTFDEAFSVAPANTDDFSIDADHVHPVSQIADGIWDEATTGHITVGTFGAQLKTVLDAVPTSVADFDMGNGRTITESLAFLRNKWTISGGTLTVYDTDDTTPLWTAVTTQTAGNPTSAIDPA